MMVCCTALVLILALGRMITAPFAASPLAWRTGDAPRFHWAARAKSLTYALQGLRWLLIEEHNARLHLCAAVVVMMIGLYLGLSAGEWAAITLSIALVFGAEAINTAIEHLCDVVSPGPNPSIGKAKDIAAGAVLICAFAACVIFGLIVLPKLWAAFPTILSLAELCGD